MSYVLCIDWAKNHIGYAMYDRCISNVILVGNTSKKFEEYCKNHLTKEYEIHSHEYINSNAYQSMQVDYIVSTIEDYFHQGGNSVDITQLDCEIILEGIYVARANRVTTSTLQARGVFITRLYEELNVSEYLEYAPKKVKLTFAGNGKADKVDIRNNIVINGDSLFTSETIQVYEAQCTETLTKQVYTVDEFLDMYKTISGKRFDIECDIGDALALLYTHNKLGED